MTSQLLNPVSLDEKTIFNMDEAHFYLMAQAAGLTIDPAIFKIILNLLRKNVSVPAILSMLRTMISYKIKPASVVKASTTSKPDLISNQKLTRQTHITGGASRPKTTTNRTKRPVITANVSSRNTSKLK